MNLRGRLLPTIKILLCVAAAILSIFVRAEPANIIWASSFSIAAILTLFYGDLRWAFIPLSIMTLLPLATEGSRALIAVAAAAIVIFEILSSTQTAEESGQSLRSQAMSFLFVMTFSIAALLVTNPIVQAVLWSAMGLILFSTWPVQNVIEAIDARATLFSISVGLFIFVPDDSFVPVRLTLLTACLFNTVGPQYRANFLLCFLALMLGGRHFPLVLPLAILVGGPMSFAASFALMVLGALCAAPLVPDVNLNLGVAGVLGLIVGVLRAKEIFPDLKKVSREDLALAGSLLLGCVGVGVWLGVEGLVDWASPSAWVFTTGMLGSEILVRKVHGLNKLSHSKRKKLFLNKAEKYLPLIQTTGRQQVPGEYIENSFSRDRVWAPTAFENFVVSGAVLVVLVWGMVLWLV